tara:strand:- start:16188 stop:16988 length:801 start_codon:yes stop_codon:yes gene_type:complete
MYSSSKRRRIKPFARPTSFDFNAAFDIRHFQRIKYGNVIDPYFPAAGTDEAFQVMEGEVLMQTQKPGVRRYGDHQMHVFSFANGLEDNDRTDESERSRQLVKEGGKAGFIKKASVLRDLKYAGVAVTGFQPEKDVFEQGFVVTVAGLNTIFNNGARILYPGDIICADIPDPTDRARNSLQTGIPHGKMQFIVSPYSVLSGQIGEQNASKFIMGTALSYSKPGDPVDVVLHKCNVIRKTVREVVEVERKSNKSKKNRNPKSTGVDMI